ncbi:hypothetical protein EYF80_010288 [Liparis tanakae]|uniref:Uncharacterized protein n=1 Tax=Liparis tanakae TaxID=230148 RepID=A0A4Z2IPR9_9TELE|nr:hypothetical protein EYF80_010288 [Liparis tanakae]
MSTWLQFKGPTSLLTGVMRWSERLEEEHRPMTLEAGGPIIRLHGKQSGGMDAQNNDEEEAEEGNAGSLKGMQPADPHPWSLPISSPFGFSRSN